MMKRHNTRTRPIDRSELTLTATAVAVGVALLAGASLVRSAEQAEHDPFESRKYGQLQQETMGGDMDSFFSDADHNRDGYLSRGEVQDISWIDESFDKMDTNQDAMVAKDELNSYVQEYKLDPFAEGRTAAGGTRYEQLRRDAETPGTEGSYFAQVDDNGDGQLSRDEITDVTWLDESFAKMDGNTDGTVSQQEFDSFVDRYKLDPFAEGRTAAGGTSYEQLRDDTKEFSAFERKEQEKQGKE